MGKLLTNLKTENRVMKKIFRTVAALAVVVFAGCTNDITDENVVIPSGNGTTINLC